MALLAMPYPFYLVGNTLDFALWDRAFQALDLLHSSRPMYRTIEGEWMMPEQLAVRIFSARVILWLPVVWSAMFLSLGVFCLAMSFRASLDLLELLRSRHIDSRTTESMTAATGGGILPRVRRLLLFMCIPLVVTEAAGLTWTFALVAEALQSTTPENVSEATGLVVGTSNLMAFLLDRAGSEELLSGPVRLFWLIAPLWFPAVIAFSVGTFLVRERRDRVRLEGLAKDFPETIDRSFARAAVSDGVKALQVQIAIVPDQEAYLRAREFGLLFRSRFLVISDRAVQVLGCDEMHAVFCHELAHFMAGHCTKHYLLRLMGQIILVGDAAIGMVEDTHGYEVEADQTAISKLGASPAALRRALVKLRTVRFLQSSSASDPCTSECPQGRSATFAAAWPRGPRSAVGAWLRLYTGAETVSYWYPSLTKRLEALAESDRRTSHDKQVFVNGME